MSEHFSPRQERATVRQNACSQSRARLQPAGVARAPGVARTPASPCRRTSCAAAAARGPVAPLARRAHAGGRRSRRDGLRGLLRRGGAGSRMCSDVGPWLAAVLYVPQAPEAAWPFAATTVCIPATWLGPCLGLARPRAGARYVRRPVHSTCVPAWGVPYTVAPLGCATLCTVAPPYTVAPWRAQAAA